MSPDQVEGQWWLPESPERRRFGRLVRDGDQSWHLVVEGGLHPPDSGDEGEAPGPDDAGPEAEVLYGRANDGSAVSLFNCWSSGFPWPDELTRETWYFQSMAQGYEPVAPDDLLTDLRIRLGPLLEWAGGHRPVVDHTDERVTITSTSVELGVAEMDEGSIRLELGHSWTVGAERAKLVPHATFRIEPSTALTFDQAMKTFVHPLRELLTFLTLTFVDVENFTAKPVWEDEKRRRLPPTTFRAQLQSPTRRPPARPRHKMLAPLSDLPGPIGDMIKHWLELRTLHEKAIGLLLLPHSAPYLYADDKFMTAFLVS